MTNKLDYTKQKAKEVLNKLNTMTGYLKQVHKSMLIMYVYNPYSKSSIQWLNENGLNKVDRGELVNQIVMKLAPKKYEFTQKQYANAYQVLKQYANNVKKYC